MTSAENRGDNKAQGWSLLHMDFANTNNRHSLMSGSAPNVKSCREPRAAIASTQGEFTTLNTEHSHPEYLPQQEKWTTNT